MDPLGSLMAWLAARGLAGLLGVTLVERLILILPSYALLVTIGIGSAQGHWSLPMAVAVSTLGGLLGCLAFYAAGAALGERRALAVARRSAWLFGVSQSKVEHLMTGFRRRERAFAFGSQLIPGVRLLAPGLAGLLRLRVAPFIGCAALGIALWNLVFIGVGHVAARVTVGISASSLAVRTLVILLVVEGLIAAGWRYAIARRHARHP
jgi:membrane protein DedA with SNARE-associated domain